MQPFNRWRDVRILVVQALQQLHREGVAQGGTSIMRDQRGNGLRRMLADAEQAIGHRIGVEARRSAIGDLVGEAPQILDQHNAQRDCHRPQFADRQRLYRLIIAYEAAQQIGIEAAIRMGDKRPGETEHARLTRKWSAAEFG